MRASISWQHVLPGFCDALYSLQEPIALLWQSVNQKREFYATQSRWMGNYFLHPPFDSPKTRLHILKVILKTGNCPISNEIFKFLEICFLFLVLCVFPEKSSQTRSDDFAPVEWWEFGVFCWTLSGNMTERLVVVIKTCLLSQGWRNTLRPRE